MNTVTFIAIDGHGGSGKSTLASILAQKMSASVIHIDDFTGLDSKDNWYERLIDKVIQPALNGKSSLNYPRAKWWQEHAPAPVVDQMVTPVIIIEGVGSFRRELRDFMALKIFVDTPRPICLARGLARDAGMGGKSDDEITAIWNQWLDWDDQYFARHDPQSVADLTISGTQSFAMYLPTIGDLLKNAPGAVYVPA